MLKLKETLFTTIKLFVLSLITITTFTTPVTAASWDSVCNDSSIDASVKEAAGCNSTGSTTETVLQNSIRPIINTVLGVVGVIAVFVIVVAGINMSASQGDPGKVAKARQTIIFAIIGLAIALLAFAIINFVLKEVF